VKGVQAIKDSGEKNIVCYWSGTPEGVVGMSGGGPKGSKVAEETVGNRIEVNSGKKKNKGVNPWSFHDRHIKKKPKPI